jgi:hypothetical protein
VNARSSRYRWSSSFSCQTRARVEPSSLSVALPRLVLASGGGRGDLRSGDAPAWAPAPRPQAQRSHPRATEGLFMQDPANEFPTCLTLVRSSVVSRAAKLLGHRLYRDRSATSCRP